MTNDTRTITLHQDDIPFINNGDCGENEFDWSEEQIVLLVTHALSTSDLDLGTQTNFRSFGVREIVEGITYSKAAYIESDSGYFLISEDMLLHLNVTYSRWD